MARREEIIASPGGRAGLTVQSGIAFVERHVSRVRYQVKEHRAAMRAVGPNAPAGYFRFERSIGEPAIADNIDSFVRPNIMVGSCEYMAICLKEGGRRVVISAASTQTAKLVDSFVEYPSSPIWEEPRLYVRWMRHKVAAQLEQLRSGFNPNKYRLAQLEVIRFNASDWDEAIIRADFSRWYQQFYTTRRQDSGTEAWRVQLDQGPSWVDYRKLAVSNPKSALIFLPIGQVDINAQRLLAGLPTGSYLLDGEYLTYQGIAAVKYFDVLREIFANFPVMGQPIMRQAPRNYYT